MKTSAGSPIRTARRQAASIVPAARERGPPVSQDQSLCTWLSEGRSMRLECAPRVRHAAAVRLVLLGGAPGVGKSAVARAVLARHRGAVGEHPLLQWVDVDALWMHQPWRVDDVMRGVVEGNLRAVLGGAGVTGVDVVLVTWTFHEPHLRNVVVGAAPDGVEVHWVQLVASEAAWRQRFEADEHRSGVDAFYEQRYAQAQTAPADLLIDTSVREVEEVAARVAQITLAR